MEKPHIVWVLDFEEHGTATFLLLGIFEKIADEIIGYAQSQSLILVALKETRKERQHRSEVLLLRFGARHDREQILCISRKERAEHAFWPFNILLGPERVSNT